MKLVADDEKDPVAGDALHQLANVAAMKLVADDEKDALPSGDFRIFH